LCTAIRGIMAAISIPLAVFPSHILQSWPLRLTIFVVLVSMIVTAFDSVRNV